MNPLRHQRIIANAGSGKTYRLTSRFIELLARGVPAEKIIALTFTRKAAGEFLDAIFERLLKASSSDMGARELAGAVGFPALKQADFHRLLEDMVRKLPQLALGTLDGFFARVVRVFPLECGLAGEITVLDPQFLDVTRRGVLAAVFRAHAANDKSFAELLELLRQESRNRQSRTVIETVDRQVATLHEKYLQTPAQHVWGDPSDIWGEHPPFQNSGHLSARVELFADELEEIHSDMEDKHREGWRELLDEIGRLKAGHVVPKECLGFALKALSAPPSKKAEECFDLKLSRKTFAFPETLRPLVEDIAKSILSIDLQTRITRSRALHALVEKFERTYQRTVRQAGKLTFLDITGMLASGDTGAWSGQSLRPHVRQAIDYRLDASYDHWLLDEFQDTSRLQWLAIRDLIDEVIQSESGRRSFFYVGDTKQAIYSWRGGDSRLFDDIARYYNASGEDRIDVSESLNTSYRSVPEILESVNTLFSPGNLSDQAGIIEFPAATLSRWQASWRQHHASNPQAGRGCVTWQTFATDEGSSFLDQQAARLAAEINPIEKGWTCAVLVQTNSRIASVVNALRAEGLPAAAEGRFFPCADNELAGALLALVHWLAHPHDTLAEKHVLMSPFATLWHEGAEHFRLAALHLIRTQGFAEAVRQWVNQAAPSRGEYLQSRFETLIEAAVEFEAVTGGTGTLDEFVTYAQGFTDTEIGSGDTIRVMTIHASKGLDFDMVILPEVQGVSLPSRRDDSSIHLHVNDHGDVDWGLDLPNKDVCEADPVLSEAYEQDVAEDCYENLCLYYVALTRAKRGLYLLTTAQKDSTTSRDFNRLLHLTFPRKSGRYVLGNEEWHAAGKPVTISAPAEPAGFDASVSPIRTARTASHPSETHSSTLPGRAILAAQASADLGVEIHAALAEVEWLPGPTPDLDSVSPEAAMLLREFLENPENAVHFEKPTRKSTLWREKAFDVVLPDGRRVAGVFDRVVVQADQALLLDFKTDDAEPAELEKRHGKQIAVYRECLAALTGLPESAIEARLVPVR
ncbi:ATP-dependent exoDNAse (exonuclease V) beta subunit [Terrimicrobium sacchariphilum]|uniref:DNA 3'-5' helicase n=1 Tax=Terrimicrobium sacchariphilum TaxID=690879 RepID=A0A146GD74_TERSA|nr:UvrD-helicase domain-containing protein [Terrimicrobium sacchariphilum]GAT35505.1 ATP-dependent exoDNAse (exonuclease V) beta subunit [Terrimicrobium sacchariphilum]